MTVSRARADMRPLTADEMANLTKLVEQRGTLVTTKGEPITVPEPIYQLLVDIIPMLKSGNHVGLINRNAQVTTQQAADILCMSRPHLIKLLDQGKMPFTRTGGHRRLIMSDVLAYQERVQEETDARLEELLALAQETDSYD